MTIPTYYEARDAVQIWETFGETKPTPLDIFIEEFEPNDPADAKVFRVMLLAALNHRTKYNETYELDDPIKVEGTQEELILENSTV